MNVEIHTLAWPNTDPRMIKAHSDVCKHLGLDVAYTLREVNHGQWMNYILDNSKADVVGFLEIDCIPTNMQIVEQSIAYCAQNKTFVGASQASNHIPPKSHIYAAPCFHFIWRETWNKLQKPTYSEVPHGDTAENVSYAAEMAGLRYKTLFPTHYTKTPDEGPWHLHTYGVYGIGTHFEGGVYHLYQARMNNNVELFVDTAKQIMDGTFNTDSMKACREV